MNSNETGGHGERARVLTVGLSALGAAAVAALFAPVESREAAPVLGMVWLADLTVGALFLLLWVTWDWLEPRRRRAGIKWEARLARCSLERHRRLGTLSQNEQASLSAWIDRREREALRHQA